MGYEVQMLVGKVHKGFGVGKDFDKDWFQLYATVDLCKPGDSALLDLSNASEEKEIYTYAVMGDGDSSVTIDRYDAKLRPIRIQDALEALYTDQRKEHYRRFGWAIALLESMAHEEGGNLSVVLWGF